MQINPTYNIKHGNSAELILSENKANSLHAVITDPPYGINILGQSWDKVLPPLSVWKACFEALRPGGFCLAFSHTRIYHRLGCQLEDAGFEIKDCLCWTYATGAPKPYNIDKAIDKSNGIASDQSYPYNPVSDNAKKWKGWSNTLKTAWEPIIMAQKPLEGNYVANVLKYNTGGINVDECRIPYRDEKDKKSLESFERFIGQNYGAEKYFSVNSGEKKQCNVHPDGRWPANLIWTEPLMIEYDHIFMIPKPSKKEKKVYNKHPTVKPIELFERLIKLVTPRPSVINEPVYVLDPFMGSGTTAIASTNLGRSFVGYELDSEFYELAEKRIKESSGNKMYDLFER